MSVNERAQIKRPDLYETLSNYALKMNRVPVPFEPFLSYQSAYLDLVSVPYQCFDLEANPGKQRCAADRASQDEKIR